MSSQKDLSKKIQIQNMVIIALAIVIVVLIAVSGTAAWYIRTKTDSADIILSNPVNIYITEFTSSTDPSGNPIYEHTLTEDILEDYNTKIYPGDKIKLKLGMQIGTEEVESSPAYVRVRLSVNYENIYTGQVSELSDLEKAEMIKYIDEPSSAMWTRVNFNKFAKNEDGTDADADWWYVLKSSSIYGDEYARIAYNLEQFVFVDGYIALDKQNVTNAQANCKFHIYYEVEAIQVVNVPDPLTNEGYGPWWGYASGDIEDLA